MEVFVKILILSVFAVSVCSVNAQQKICDLRIIIQDRIGKKTLRNAKVTLTNSIGEKFENKISGNDFIYSGLQSNYYELSAQTEGFKKSFKRIVLICDEADEKNIVSKSLYLVKGNETETVQIIDKDFAVLQKSDFIGVNGLALSLPKPKYPDEAKETRAASKVIVNVLIDESGKVESAEMLSGNPVFKEAAEKAALKSLFIPSVINGENVKVNGSIVYSFVP